METLVLSINKATYMKGYKINLVFSDGREQLIDFEPFLKGHRNPMITKFVDLDNFKRYELKEGDLIWGDFELCFPIWDLYEGNI